MCTVGNVPTQGHSLIGQGYVKGANKSTLGKDSLVHFMYHEQSDLGSLILIWIISKEHTLTP